MNLEIIRPDGDLKRETWSFALNAGWTGAPCIYISDYSFQTKASTRHKWVRQTHWDRLNRRENNIGEPPIPSDVEAEMRDYYQKMIRELPIVK